MRCAIAISLQEFLDKNSIKFETLQHKFTETSLNTAAAAHVPSKQLAKAVVLGDKNQRRLMAILPANRKLVVSAINDMTCGGV